MSEIFELSKAIIDVYREGIKTGRDITLGILTPDTKLEIPRRYFAGKINLETLEKSLYKEGWTSNAVEYVTVAIEEKERRALGEGESAKVVPNSATPLPWSVVHEGLSHHIIADGKIIATCNDNGDNADIIVLAVTDYLKGVK